MQKNFKVKNSLSLLTFMIIGFFSSVLYGQNSTIINPSLLNHKWSAQWISYPEGSLKDYGIYNFRKTFNLREKPKQFIIHVSGDNRYKLFINGIYVCNGPARGDLMHWRFNSIDIAKYLIKGKNVLAAVVWNFGNFRPLAQITNKTAFIVQGDSKKEEVVNTGGTWKVYKDEAYIPPAKKPAQTVVGPGDDVVASKYPWGWEMPGYNDRAWKSPRLLGEGVPYGKFEGWDWMLVPRKIPFLEYKLQRIKKVVHSENIKVNGSFLKGKSPLQIPAYSKVEIVLDQTYETTAYPVLIVSGGRNSKIKISYAEAFINKNGQKDNRNKIKGKKLDSDYSDIFIPDGGNNRRFESLWFRTYRYIELTIETKKQPLSIKDFFGYFTAYPFKERAYFKSNDSTLSKIWNVGWRTIRLCSGETFYDCPYYEQMQYIGDTRIEALISLYVSGDDRLMKNAIELFHDSQLSNGLTQSRYPSSHPQIIPPFSLYWISMIHDFWMLRNDTAFVKKYLHSIKNILYWFHQHIDADGMLGSMNWWNFVDWSFGPWNSEKPIGGVPLGGITGNSSILTLEYVSALQKASDLFEAFGNKYQAQKYIQISKHLLKKTYELCWSKKRGLLADTPAKKEFSQHANIMAVIDGMFNNIQSRTVMQKVLSQKDLIQCTYYYRFYLNRALDKAGMANRYLSTLGPWKNMLSLGLTTFAEEPEPTRSDCHGWSASPVYEFLATVCGIKPGTPGFKSVKIEPHLGDLKVINVKVPHPKGNIIVKLKRIGKEGIEGDISLPDGVSGEFIWKGKIIPLKAGIQKVKL